MKAFLFVALFVGLTLVLFFAASRRGHAEAAEGSGPMIIHNVYFSLKDNSPEAKKKLVAACKKYLSKHPGTVFFAAGTRGAEFDRSVNDRDWDVALHIVFQDK